MSSFLWVVSLFGMRASFQSIGILDQLLKYETDRSDSRWRMEIEINALSNLK